MKFMVCVSGDRDEFQYIPDVMALDAGVELQSYGLTGCQSPEAWENKLRNHIAFRKNYPGSLAVHGPFKGNIQFDAVFEALHQWVPEVTASLEVNSDKDTVMSNLRKMIRRYKR